MPVCSAPVHTRIGDRSHDSPPRIKHRGLQIYLKRSVVARSRPGWIASYTSIAETKLRNSPTTTTSWPCTAQGRDISIHFQQASLFDSGLYLFQRGTHKWVPCLRSFTSVLVPKYPSRTTLGSIFISKTAPTLWRAPDKYYYLVAVILWDTLVDAFRKGR